MKKVLSMGIVILSISGCSAGTLNSNIDKLQINNKTVFGEKFVKDIGEIGTKFAKLLQNSSKDGDKKSSKED